MLTATRVKNGASRANGYTANSAGFARAAENGPVLVYGHGLGTHAIEQGYPIHGLGQEAADTGFSKSLTATLVIITGLFGAVSGFALGYVVRGRKV
jgi:putative effector of murein hydrolase